VGDIVSVTLFEAESGGLFIPKDAASRPGNFVQLPNEQVDRNGNITIPYIPDPVHVAGRSTHSVSEDITQRLKERAIEPQALVSIVEHRGNDVSVLGDVSTPVRFSLDPGGIRLTGAIAKAGGPKDPAYETLVTVKRQGAVQTAELTAIVKEPAQDILMAPGDMVYVAREPRIYMVLGATPSPGALGGVNNRRFTFENETMNLAEALSKSGGLDSNRSDPAFVFLFRYESTKLLSDLNVDVSQFSGPVTPTVYKVPFASADGFFLSNQFNIRDKDIIFVADSAGSDINKLLTIAVGASETFLNVSDGATGLNLVHN
jgi:polysaccharide biosynthesis/export protein